MEKERERALVSTEQAGRDPDVAHDLFKSCSPLHQCTEVIFENLVAKKIIQNTLGAKSTSVFLVLFALDARKLNNQFIPNNNIPTPPVSHLPFLLDARMRETNSGVKAATVRRE